MAFQPGDKIGKFEVVRVITTRGHSEVYEVRETVLNTRWVIKTLSPSSDHYLQHVPRLQEEATLLDTVRGPYTVQLRDFQRPSDGPPYLVMEYLDGPPLAERISPDAPPEQRWSWALQLAEAAASIHKRGVVHRDLKPQNLMFDRDNQLKVIDLDAALSLDTRRDDRLTTLNTNKEGPHSRLYRAPENPSLANCNYDVFSAGVILAEIWLGHHPWNNPGITEGEENEYIKDPTRWWPALAGLDPRLVAVIKKATAAHSKDRYRDGKELHEALERTVKRRDRRWVVVALLASALGGGGALAWRSLPDLPDPAPISEPAPISKPAPQAPTFVAMENPFIPIPLPPAPVRLGIPEGTPAPPSRAFEPVANVFSPAYRYAVQEHEVTWSEFGAWCEARGDAACTQKARQGGARHQPAHGIARATAVAYCKDLQGDLPTEPEWEWAARGAPDGTLRPHAWGDEPLDPDRTRALRWRVEDPAGLSLIELELTEVKTNLQDVTPDTHLYDLTGNALEWTDATFLMGRPSVPGHTWRNLPAACAGEDPDRKCTVIDPAAVRGLPLLEGQVYPKDLPALTLDLPSSAIWRHPRWAGDGVPTGEKTPAGRLEGVGFRCVQRQP